jgi:hypothetical protein
MIMTMDTPRKRFIDYVRRGGATEPIISPFLPYRDVIEGALKLRGLPVGEDPIADEITLAGG